MEVEWNFVLPDRKIGRYPLVKRVGGGTSGTVFLATDPKYGNSNVAIKLMRAPAAGASGSAQVQEQAHRRFEVETRALHELSHRDVVQVIDGGLWQGRGWLAMEWLPGHDLSRYTHAGRLLPEALAVHVAERLAKALDHVHSRGIIHRDVKPGNVRVHLPAGLVKLSDFGVARLEENDVTGTSMMLGSPAYMAPELLAGGPASPRSDLYALGVSLFELLAGRRPFEADTLGEWMKQVASTDAPHLAQLKPELPTLLGDLVAQLLARDPTQRPANGAEVAAVLAQVQTQVQTQGTPSALATKGAMGAMGAMGATNPAPVKPT